MAVCRIIETGATPEEYERVRNELGIGEGLPAGSSLHVAAVGEDGTIRIVEVWEAREQADEFGEKVRATRERIGVGVGRQPQVTYFEVHTDRRS